MKKIILYEHGSSANHGCEAIVRSTCDVLGLSRNNSILFTNDKASDREYGLNQIINVDNSNQYSLSDNIKRVFRKVSKGRMFYDIETSQNFVNKKWRGAISIGGDNYCYVGLVPDLIKRHQALREAGNKVILWGASFKEQLFDKEVIDDLKSYDLITVRESLSAQYLANAGIDNYIMTFDSAFTLKSIETEWPDNKKHENIVGINISPLLFCYADKNRIMNCYINLINYILNRTDFEIGLIPHVTVSGTDDREPILEIKSQYSENERVIAITNNYNCCQIKSLISKCKFFIGARTHATIAAYSSFVPTCVLGYSAKSIGIAQDLFGSSKLYVVDSMALNSENLLIQSFEYLLEHESEIKRALQNNIPQKIETLLKASKQVKNYIFNEY